MPLARDKRDLYHIEFSNAEYIEFCLAKYIEQARLYIDKKELAMEQNKNRNGVFMNKPIEENFVNSYIIKNKRNRLFFELCGKKRRDCIGRFSHCADSLLIEAKIKIKGQYILNELRDIIAKANCKKCYVISYFEELDGKEFSKDEVLDLISNCGMPSIVIFDNFAIIQTEQEQGPAIKYLLQD